MITGLARAASNSPQHKRSCTRQHANALSESRERLVANTAPCTGCFAAVDRVCVCKPRGVDVPARQSAFELGTDRRVAAAEPADGAGHEVELQPANAAHDREFARLCALVVCRPASQRRQTGPKHDGTNSSEQRCVGSGSLLQAVGPSRHDGSLGHMTPSEFV